MLQHGVDAQLSGCECDNNTKREDADRDVARHPSKSWITHWSVSTTEEDHGSKEGDGHERVSVARQSIRTHVREPIGQCIFDSAFECGLWRIPDRSATEKWAARPPLPSAVNVTDVSMGKVKGRVLYGEDVLVLRYGLPRDLLLKDGPDGVTRSFRAVDDGTEHLIFVVEVPHVITRLGELLGL